jgi:hypothetical protein
VRDLDRSRRRGRSPLSGCHPAQEAVATSTLTARQLASILSRSGHLPEQHTTTWWDRTASRNRQWTHRLRRTPARADRRLGCADGFDRHTRFPRAGASGSRREPSWTYQAHRLWFLFIGSASLDRRSSEAGHAPGSRKASDRRALRVGHRHNPTGRACGPVPRPGDPAGAVPHPGARDDLPRRPDHKPRIHRTCRNDGTDYGTHRDLERVDGTDGDLDPPDGVDHIIYSERSRERWPVRHA